MINRSRNIVSIFLLAVVLLLAAGCGQTSSVTTTATTAASISSATETGNITETLPTTADETAESQLETSFVQTEPVTEEPSAEETTKVPTTAATTAASTTTEPPLPIVKISIECHKAREAGMAGAPEDGIILPTVEIELEDGESVWDILFRVAKAEGIAVNKIGSGSSLLVNGIAGLAMSGPGTGWIYSVNGEVPGVSAGAYKLQPGDEIKWQYTLDSGNDL